MSTRVGILYFCVAGLFAFQALWGQRRCALVLTLVLAGGMTGCLVGIGKLAFSTPRTDDALVISAQVLLPITGLCEILVCVYAAALHNDAGPDTGHRMHKTVFTIFGAVHTFALGLAIIA